MKRYIFLILIALISWSRGWGQQANVDYEVRTTYLYSNNANYFTVSQCRDGLLFNYSEEYRGLVSFSDNSSPNSSYFITSPCLEGNCNDACSYGTNVLIGSNTNKNASYISLTFEGWEENGGLIGGGNCTFNASGAGSDNGGCHFWDYRTEYFRGSTPSSFSTTALSSFHDRGQYTTGAHQWGYRFKWKYTGSANLITPVCTQTSPAYSSGIIPSWSVNMTAGRQYSFSAPGRELRLYGTTGFTLMTSGTSSISYTCPTTGIYYIEISGAGRTTTPSAGTMYYSCMGQNCDPLNTGVTAPCTIATQISGGATNASVTLSTCGGIPNYKYYMDGVQIASTSASSYTYTIPLSTTASQNTHFLYMKDNQNRQTSTVSVTVPVPGYAAMTATNILNQTLCTPNQTINISTTASGGQGTKTYTLYRNTQGAPVQIGSSNTSGTFTITGTNSQVSTYYVQITDAFCSIAKSFAINTPPAVTVTTPTPLYVGCQGSSTTNIQVSGTGGKTPLTYSWSSSNGQSASTYQSSTTLTGLPVGTDTIYVKDANNCVKTTTVSVQYPTFTISATNTGYANGTNIYGQTTMYSLYSSGNRGWATFNIPAGITITSAQIQFEKLNGTSGANSYLTIFSGNPMSMGSSLYSTIMNSTQIHNGGWGTGSNYNSYSINPLGLSFLQTNIGNSVNIGFYRNSSIACDISGYASSNPPRLLITGIPSNLTLTASAPPILCNGGQTTITGTITGGVAPYQYKVGTNGTWVNINNATTFAVSGQIAGAYTIYVKDAITNCSTSFTIQIPPAPLPLSATLSAATPNLPCFGNTTTLTAAATGGTMPYSWSLNGGAFQTNPTFTTIAAGNYTVTVKDANNCPTVTTNSVTISQPTALTATASTGTNTLLCNGNGYTIPLTVTASGGTPTYSYTLNGNPQTSNVFNVSYGTHTVNIQDVNGCTTSTTTTVALPTITIQAMATAYGTGAVSASSKSDNSINVNNSNKGWASFMLPILPYNTQITSVRFEFEKSTPSGSGTVELRGFLGYIDASTNAAVLYNNCGGSILLNSPSPFPGGLGNKQISFLNSSFIQSNLGGRINIGINNPSGSLIKSIIGWGTSSNINANRPRLVISYLPSPLDGSVTQNEPSCNGFNDGNAVVNCLGGFTVNTSGISVPYTYTWNTNPMQTAQTATNLYAGNYSVTIQDANGCQKTIPVVLTEPPVLTITPTVTSNYNNFNVSCNGASDANAIVTATGGTSPYNFTWDTNPIQLGSFANNIPVGNYTVTVLDNNGCMESSLINVSEPPPLTTTMTQSNVSCFGGNNGTASVTATGGVPSYTYTWNTTPMQYTATASGLAAGTYTITAKDANNCTANTSVTISQPNSPLQISVTNQNNLLCAGATTGSVSVSASGGTPAISPPQYVYSWNDGQTNPTATNLGGGVHTVWVQDANNCTETLNINITNPPAITLTAKLLRCTDSLLQYNTIIGNVSGGVAPYSYNYICNNLNTNGSTNCGWIQNNLSTPISCGNITVTDANGCSLIDTLITTNPHCAFSIDTFDCRPVKMKNGEVHVCVPFEANETFSCADSIEIHIQVSNASFLFAEVSDVNYNILPAGTTVSSFSSGMNTWCIRLKKPNGFHISNTGKVCCLDFVFSYQNINGQSTFGYPDFNIVKVKLY